MVENPQKIQQYKIDAVSELKEFFGNSRDIIFTDYRGLTVEQITNLRTQLRENNAVLKVVKNRFAKIALKEMQYPEVNDQLTGPTAIALSLGDSGPVAKTLLKFSEDAALDVKGGIVDGNVFTPEQIAAYSKLPGKEQLIAQLMSVMKAPLQNLVFVINGVPQKLVRTLQAVADKKAQG